MKRPIFTLPLPSVLIKTLISYGYKNFDDMYQNNEVRDEVLTVLKSNGYEWTDIQSATKAPLRMSANKIYRRENEVKTLPTFSESLDEILGGGICRGSVLQVCGLPGSAKTQLLMQLCITVQLPESLGGLEGEAIFIDSESSFSRVRFTQMAEGAYEHCQKVSAIHGLLSPERFTINSLLSGVHYIQITSHLDLLSVLSSLEHFLNANAKVKLIVLDSLVLPFLNFSKTLDRTRLISQVVTELSRLAQQYQLAVAFSNHLTTRISASDKHFVPALGETLSHLSPTVLLLNRHGASQFSALVYKSSCCKQSVIHFGVEKQGIRDIS